MHRGGRAPHLDTGAACTINAGLDEVSPAPWATKNMISVPTPPQAKMYTRLGAGLRPLHWVPVSPGRQKPPRLPDRKGRRVPRRTRRCPSETGADFCPKCAVRLFVRGSPENDPGKPGHYQPRKRTPSRNLQRVRRAAGAVECQRAERPRCVPPVFFASLGPASSGLLARGDRTTAHRNEIQGCSCGK